MTALRLGAAALLGALVVLAGCSATAADKKVPVRVRVSCSEMHEILAAMPFDRVKGADVPVADPHTAVQRPGCQIVARGSRERLSVLERTQATRPDARLRELLVARGWQEDKRYAADAPTRTGFAYRMGGVICHTAARWAAPDAGSDPNALVDPDALPPDTYEITVGCAESPS